MVMKIGLCRTKRIWILDQELALEVGLVLNEIKREILSKSKWVIMPEWRS
jgi:hypothetical protein